tara:strand:+ start:282 stop:566 length:285 start_codon:yes stop_codon:yes gene_type:complete
LWAQAVQVKDQVQHPLLQVSQVVYQLLDVILQQVAVMEEVKDLRPAVLVDQVVEEDIIMGAAEQVIPLRLLFLKEIQEVMKLILDVMVVQVEEQ